MGWIRWGLSAARRASRRSRGRRRYSYSDQGFRIVADYLMRLGENKQAEPQPQPAPIKKVKLEAPSSFKPQSSWEWVDSDIDYYRYATEKWKVHTFEHWGVLELPAGKDAGYNFFGILRLHQEDDRGSLARGAGPGGEIDSELPVLLLFRISDGYHDGFAAVQSWSLIERLIEQDRPLRDAGQYPRALPLP